MGGWWWGEAFFREPHAVRVINVSDFGDPVGLFLNHRMHIGSFSPATTERTFPYESIARCIQAAAAAAMEISLF